MITKLGMRKLILSPVLGVILLGAAGSGLAWAAPFSVTPYCDGARMEFDSVGSGVPECRTGQLVTVTAQNGQGPVMADWDPDYNDPFEPFQPEQFNTDTFQYRYQTPDEKTIMARATDGSGDEGGTRVDIVDAAILTEEPAFRFTPVHPRRPNGGDQYEAKLFRGGTNRGDCVVHRSVGYYAYRDHTYRAGIVARYRFVKKKRVRGPRRFRQVVRKGRLAMDREPGVSYVASYDHRFAGVAISLQVWGKEARRRWRRFERLGARFVVILRERIVAADGSTLYYTKRRNWFDPVSCEFIEKPQKRKRARNRRMR